MIDHPIEEVRLVEDKKYSHNFCHFQVVSVEQDPYNDELIYFLFFEEVFKKYYAFALYASDMSKIAVNEVIKHSIPLSYEVAEDVFVYPKLTEENYGL